MSKDKVLPIKLVDCENILEEDSELFIVEGDSALGALKAARDSKYQALIPIRGKILNVLKASKKEITENKEIQDIIKCLGVAPGDYDESKLRYKKIIIAADADADGENISMLLLVLFYELYPQLVKNGRLYKALTPLYIVKETKSKKTHYFYTTKEYENGTQKLKANKVSYTVTRAKGLGEAGAETLHVTGMNKDTRTIERILVGDIAEAREWLNITMGTDVEPRKKWIMENKIDMDNIVE